VPRAQGHTRRKHGRESLQPLVIDEVRQGSGLARGLRCFGWRAAWLRAGLVLRPSLPKLEEHVDVRDSAAHHVLSCMYCARKCELTYTILTIMKAFCLQFTTVHKQYMYM
jgi:hypothetical protein